MKTTFSLLCFSVLFASAGATIAHASEASAGTGLLVIDCSNPSLPSQRAVGEMTAQHNFSQVYATRARLMAEVHRACQREGITRVLVQQTRPKPERLARQASPRR